MPPTRAASLTKRRDSSQSKQGKLGFATRKSSLQTKKKKADLITPIPPKEKPTTTLPIAADAIVDPDPDPEQTSQYQDLDPEDKDILQESKRILRSRNVPKIHAKDLTHIDHILRDFDLNAQFGPCVGMTRLERWERANKMGLEPPAVVHKILITNQGRQQDDISQGVFYKQV